LKDMIMTAEDLYNYPRVYLVLIATYLHSLLLLNWLKRVCVTGRTPRICP